MARALLKKRLVYRALLYLFGTNLTGSARLREYLRSLNRLDLGPVCPRRILMVLSVPRRNCEPIRFRAGEVGLVSIT